MANCLGCKKQKDCYNGKLKKINSQWFTNGNQNFPIRYVVKNNCEKTNKVKEIK